MDLRTVQGQLGHASIVLTSDTYTSVLPELHHEAAEATARLVLTTARRTGHRLQKRTIQLRRRPVSRSAPLSASPERSCGVSVSQT
ncbi:hypothetical protein [Nonomuraea roseola]|uniref:hypothetical protein n=1 Tax=Nonomuraea roseola TaxID=46179 RepID=UPI003D15DD8A